jgi:hypothetical protein
MHACVVVGTYISQYIHMLSTVMPKLPCGQHLYNNQVKSCGVLQVEVQDHLCRPVVTLSCGLIVTCVLSHPWYTVTPMRCSHPA